MQKYINIFWKIFLALTLLFLVLFFYWELTDKKKEIFSEWKNHVVFMLDVSQSMNVQDMQWNTRLAAAKQKIFESMSQNIWYEFALSIFAGESQRVLPFTQDISLFVTFLRWIDSNNLMVQWTDINTALIDAVTNFNVDQSGNIIILTDGDEDKISLDTGIIEILGQQDIWISIIGIWTQEWWPIPSGNIFNPYKTYNWKRVQVWLNSWGLKTLAKKLWWKYYDFDDEIMMSWDIKNTDINHEKNIFILLAWLMWILYILSLWYTLYYDKK